MDQLAQVNLHFTNGIMPLVDLILQVFQVSHVLQKLLGILLVRFLQRFQIHHGLLVFLASLFVLG